MAEQVQFHPALGVLRWNARLDSWEAAVDLRLGIPIRFAIVAEAEWADVEPSSLFEIATEFLAWARDYDPGDLFAGHTI